MRLVISLLLLACSLQAQLTPENRLTFSGGWSSQISPSYEGGSATSLGLTYGYRSNAHIEFEAGVQTSVHPAAEIRGANYDFFPDDLYLWVPFGVRFIAPLAHNRFEISAGGGGLYQHYSVNDPVPLRYNAWGGYLVQSTSVALDDGRHFWLGIAPRFFLANGDSHRDRWFTITGEFSFRF